MFQEHLTTGSGPRAGGDRVPRPLWVPGAMPGGVKQQRGAPTPGCCWGRGVGALPEMSVCQVCEALSCQPSTARERITTPRQRQRLSVGKGLLGAMAPSGSSPRPACLRPGRLGSIAPNLQKHRGKTPRGANPHASLLREGRHTGLFFLNSVLAICLLAKRGKTLQTM